MNNLHQFWSEVRSLFSNITRQADTYWVKRSPSINSAQIIMVILKLVSSRQFQGYGISLGEFWERSLDCNLKMQSPPANSSFCEARYKVHEDFFLLFSRGIVELFLRLFKPILWHGHRVFAIDGTRLNLPRPLSKLGYAVPKGSHYPQGLLSCLYELGHKLPYEFSFSPRLNERAQVIRLIQALKKDDLIVFDRGYLAYWLLEALVLRGIHSVFRVQDSSFAPIREFISSSLCQACVLISRPKKHSKDKECLQEIKVRLIKYEINGKIYCLATTLLDQNITAEDLTKLYHSRWGIEELYKITKKHFEIEDFHSHSRRGVKQEIYSHFILIIFARVFALQAENELNSADCPEGKPSHKIQANFKNCLQTLGRNLERLIMAHKLPLSALIKRILGLIKRLHAHARPHRSFPRISRKPGYKWSIGGYQRRTKDALAIIS